MDGYYEWQGKGKHKTAWYIHDHGNKLLLAAGLWESWIADDQNKVESFTVITVPAADSIAHIHDRMPAFISVEKGASWMSAEVPVDDVLTLLQPKEGLAHYTVSSYVNKAGNEGETCIRPYGQAELF